QDPDRPGYEWEDVVAPRHSEKRGSSETTWRGVYWPIRRDAFLRLRGNRQALGCGENSASGHGNAILSRARPRLAWPKWQQSCFCAEDKIKQKTFRSRR